jgi:hypothetical protein
MNETLLPTNEKERKELSFLLTLVFTGIYIFKRGGDMTPIDVVRNARSCAVEVTAFSKDLDLN